MAEKRICPDCGQPMSRTTQGANTVDACKKCGYQINISTGKVIRGHNAKIGQQQFLNCPNCNARLSAPKNQGLMQLDCPYCLHNWPFDTGEPIPNESQWHTPCPKCGKAVLVNKNEGPRKITCPHCQQVWRFQSDTGEHLPDATVIGDKIIVTCPKCGRGNRVPTGQGNLRITCRGCDSQFYLSGDPALNQPSTAKTPQYRPQPKSSPEPQSRPEPQPQTRPQGTPCRTITIERATHAYKEWDIHGLENAFRDKWVVRIVLDEVEQGHLKADAPMVLNVDSGEHTIRYNLLSPKYRIPAGTDNYIVSYFRDNFRIGPENDDFRDNLTLFVVKMFRSRGMKDRILDLNNSSNTVCLDINQDGIRLYWHLAHTKGLKQFLTGESEEKISYQQIGLTPLAEEKQPTGYWDFLQMWIETAILQDDEADMEKSGGGFTFRTKHNLF